MVAVLDSLRSMMGKSRETAKAKYCKAIEAAADGKGSTAESVMVAIQEMGKTVEEFEADVELFKQRRKWIADIEKAAEATKLLNSPDVSFNMIGMVDQQYKDDMGAAAEELREIRLRQQSGKLSESNAEPLRTAALKKEQEAAGKRRRRELDLTAAQRAGSIAEDNLINTAHQSLHDRGKKLIDDGYELPLSYLGEAIDRQKRDLDWAYLKSDSYPNMEANLKSLEKRLADAKGEQQRIGAESGENRQEMLGLFAFLG
jgi:hypothetical protein